MESKFKISSAEKNLAKKANIASLLSNQGEKLEKQSGQYVWRKDGHKIVIKGHIWFDFYAGEGGDALDLAMKYYSLPFREAVKWCLSGGINSVSDVEVALKKGFRLPPAHRTNNRVIRYLTVDRGIDPDVLYRFIAKQMIFESEKYHDAVFVGFDTVGKPRHAHVRGSSLKSNVKITLSGSDAGYSLHWLSQYSDSLYCFESPVDMLSFITMNQLNWKCNSYVASCSVSDKAILQCLNDSTKTKTVYLCFDNDEAGQRANKAIAEKLKLMNIKNEILVPKLKDWNEDLLYLRGEKLCRE